MDAQNANEAAPPKPSASSASSRPNDSDRQKPSSSSVVARSPALSRATLPSKDAKPSSKSALGPASNESLKTSGSKSSTTASRDLKENKEPKDQKDTKDSKDPKDPKNSKEAKEPSHAKESRDTKDSREPKDHKDHKDAKNTKDTKDTKDTKETKSITTAPSRNKHQDFTTDESSEAETIVLSKDGSPAKPRNRKVIKHEDKTNGASSSISVASADSLPRRHLADKKDGQSDKPSRSAVDIRDGSDPAVKKKRLHDKLAPSSKDATRGKNTSNSLSSVPGSPPHSRNTSSHPPSGSDTDHLARRPKATKRALSTASRDKLQPPEKLVPGKRKALKYDSDDDIDAHSKARRQRLANAGSEARSSKDSPRLSHGNSSNSGSLTKSLMSRSSRDASLNRSESPPPRSHRRSLSTHATSQSNGLAIKKKRVPAPLQTTDYGSDDSSASGSSRVRSAKLRNLAIPTTAESSPAKIVAHKKHLDAHGQTYLARACARGELDMAKKRLAERPEDLNTADFAGNTPLQIAALNGYGNIVKLLIDAGCNLDCVNNDKDTPLLDAVDNGHLEVVKLLLDAGVNPRKANVNGEEPLDRVDESVDNADAIRTALIAAKKNVGGRRITSEEHHPENDDLRSIHDLDESPRRSPAPGGSSRRAGTIRATKTSNHLLYMPMDDKTLRLAAGRGDEQNVIRILQVRDAFDDPESMVAASRGGHDVVLQLLLALGKANPDPAPVPGVPPEHATPILAAIGQENIKVVSLLLEQSNFDPTQRFNGETYYEIARQRAGPNWKEEEDILKKAYDSYKKQNGNKTKSPPQKNSDSRRAARAVDHSDEPSTAPRALKRKLSSSSLDRPKKTGSTIKAASGSSASTREDKETSKQKRDSSTLHSERERHSSPKRATSSSITAKTKPRDERSSVVSNMDRDTPPPTKQVKSRKTDSDSVAMSSEGETKPRRKKLVSGRELKDGKVREKEKEKEKEKEQEKEKEREKQDKQEKQEKLEKKRRSSLASTNTATPPKDSASPHESRNDDAPSEKARVDKHRERDRDRARQLKKEDSKDAGTSGDSAGKRHRSSETPPHATSSDKDGSEAPVKRRRLDADSETPAKVKKISKISKDGKPSSLSSLYAPKSASRREGSADERKSSVSVSSAAKPKKRDASTDRARKEPKEVKDRDSKDSKSSQPPIEKSIHVKSEDVDVEMADVSDAQSAAAEAKAQRDKKRAEKAEKAEAEAKKKDEETQHRRKEEDDKKKEMEEKKKKKEEEEKRKREEEEAERLKEEEKKAEEKKKEEEARKAAEEKKKVEKEELNRKKEEEERQRKEEERKRKEEEEKTKREEAERKRVEEERKRKREAELAEEHRKKREEEERLQKEKLAREEAAKEVQRKREEEERQERLKLEQEQLERERARAEKEAEERRLQLEEYERNRVASLPPLLRWLSAHPNPKQAELASLFKVMQGVRYDCINTDANGTAAGREQWLLNTQVALLFGDKDLELTRYPTWRHLPVSQVAKQIIWNLESDRYALTDPLLFDLGAQLPDLYGTQGPRALGSMGLSKLRNDASEKFFATDMFFVKVADVMATVPSLPHLHDVRMALNYRELPEHESQLQTLSLNPKWKSDPDADKNLGFAPGTKYFVNGTQIGENRAGLAKHSKTPPRAVRVPRRGFVSVAFNDPEFELICKEQSIDPFSFPAYNMLKAQSQPQLANGVPKVNGTHPLTNGTLPNGQSSRPAVNGINVTNGTNGS